MQDLASEFSQIVCRWYARTLTVGGGYPLLHPTPSPALARCGVQAPRCWDPNLRPPQLFSHGCALYVPPAVHIRMGIWSLWLPQNMPSNHLPARQHEKKQIILIRMHLPVTYTFRQPWSLYSTHKKPHQVANQEIRHFARPKAAQVGLMPQKTSSSFWHYSAHRNILYSNTAGPHTTVARF